jgi:hypothetical protein
VDPSTHGLTLSVTTAYTATESSLDTFSGDIPVPMTGQGDNKVAGRRSFILSCYCVAPIITDATGTSAAALTQAGRDQIRFRGAGATDVGRILHFSNPSIEPRRVVGYNATSGIYTVEPPLGSLPVEGTDTVTTRDVVGVNLYSMSIYEKIVTSYVATHGRI